MIPIPLSFFQPQTFSPEDLGGLAIWVDASDASNYTLSGTDYTSINNKGDLGGVFAPSTVAKRPAQGTKGNGLNYMIFDGAVDTCIFSDITLDLTHTDKLTMFWCGQHTATGNGLFYEHSNTTNGKDNAFIFNINANTEFGPSLRGDVGYCSTNISGANTSPLSTDELYSVKMDKGKSTNEVYDHRKNGDTKTVTYTNNNNNTNLFGDHIGYIGARGNTTSVDLDGLYYELLIFDKILTTDEIGQVNTYLNSKWDLY